MSKYVVGLSGGIGSGKTTVSDLFAKQGIDIIDADLVARDVVKPNSEALQAIITRFGQTITNEDGQLNRSQLRSLVFSNDQHRLWLNGLLHPIIRRQIEARILDSKSIYCLLVAPLLIENHLDKLVDRVLIVDVNQSIQVQRTVNRDHCNAKEVKAIIASQVDRAQRISRADDIVNNDSTDQALLQANIVRLHHQYLNLSTKAKDDNMQQYSEP